MDIVVKFDVLWPEGITRGLLMGHPEGKGYAAIISTSRLASVDLSQGIVVGNLIGDGETWYMVDKPHPCILIKTIDVFVCPTFVTNFN